MSKMNLHIEGENYYIYADSDNGYIKVTRKNHYSTWHEEYWFCRTHKGNIKLLFSEDGPKIWDNPPMDGILFDCDYNEHNLKVLAQDIFQEEEPSLPIIGMVEKYWKTKTNNSGRPIHSLRERIIPVNNKKK